MWYHRVIVFTEFSKTGTSKVGAITKAQKAQSFHNMLRACL